MSNFMSTASTYFILTMNLHVISSANLALNLSHVIQCKEEKNDFISDSCSNATTYYTLDNKRTLTIDYSARSKWKTSIKVLIPNLIVWLIATFISFPSFFITNITIGDSKACSPKRLSYDLMSILGLSEITMISIKTFVPVCLIFITLLVIAYKIRKVENLDEDLIDENLMKIIKMSIAVSIIFLIFQAPKLILDAILLFLRDLNVKIIQNVMCIIYLFGVLMRLILCRILL